MIISCDASQLEWRVAIELSGDQTGLYEIRDKQDTHSLNQTAFGLPSRLIAKIYLFRTIFRGSGWAFANDPEFSHVSSSAKYWDGINEKFYSKYAGLDAWHQRLAGEVMQGHAIVGPFGRAWTINIPRGQRGELKVPWTTLSNYPVQGTGADIIKMVRVMMYSRVKKAGIPCQFITTVHDSIVIDADKQYLEAIVKLFHGCFGDLIQAIQTTFKYTWTVPLECECKYGPNMKDLVKYAST